MQQEKTDNTEKMGTKGNAETREQTKPTPPKRKKKWEVISLNAGCGALDLALILAGIYAASGKEEMQEALKDRGRYEKLGKKCPFVIREAYETNREARMTYEANSIYGIKVQETVPESFAPVEMVLGMLPAPGPELDKAYQELMRCLRESTPNAAAIRVNRALATHAEEPRLRKMLINIRKNGYNAVYAPFRAEKYGVAETRKESFIICVRKNIKFSYEPPAPTHGMDGTLLPYATLWDTIGHLESNPGPYYKGKFNPVYTSRNRKKGWDDLSSSIQDSGKLMPLHPSGGPMKDTGVEGLNRWEIGEEPNRRLSVSEAAAIQTFPAWFKFCGGERKEGNPAILPAYRWIGRSCPVLLAMQVFLPLAELAKGMTSGRIKEKLPEEIPCTLTVSLADGHTLRDYKAALVAMDNAAFAVKLGVNLNGNTPDATDAKQQEAQQMLEKMLKNAKIQASWCGKKNIPKAVSGNSVRTVRTKNCTVILCGKDGKGKNKKQ